MNLRHTLTHFSTTCLLLTAPLATQQLAELAPKSQLPPDATDSFAIALGDLNGDGHPDVLVGDYGSTPRLYHNDGHARFVEASPGTIPASPSETYDLELLDFDRDGDLDVFEANRGADRLLRNDGATFTDVSASALPATTAITFAAASGDVDGDGRLDLWLTGYGADRLFLAQGGGFVDATAGRLPATATGGSAVALADVDRDGDLDAMTGGSERRLFLNDGTGHFADVTASHVPAIDRSTSSLAFGDVDGDGDLDVFLGNTGGELSPRGNGLFLSDGTGHFTDVSQARLPSNFSATEDVALGDLDADGDLDVITANVLVLGPLDPDASRFWRNDGHGTFTFPTESGLRVESWPYGAVALGDLDGDGDLDVVFGTQAVSCCPIAGSRTRVFLNDGTGRLVDVTAENTPFLAETKSVLATGDVDGDGDQDLIIGNETAPNRVLVNDGAGRFEVRPDALPQIGALFTTAIAVFDADHDGAVDLFCANDRQDSLYLGDGHGGFTDVTATHLPPDFAAAVAVRAADVTGDGHTDLLALNDTGLTLLPGDGAGHFAATPAGSVPPLPPPLTAMVCGDVDGDGDADVVIGSGGQDLLLVNDGLGRFTDHTAGSLPLAPGASTLSIALADVDRDGDLDLVFGDIGPNRLYANDGHGHFLDVTARSLPSLPGSTRALVLADFDADGDLDLYAGNGAGFIGEPDHLLLNDGHGRFTDVTATRLDVPIDATQNAIAFDADGDDDPDVVLVATRCFGHPAGPCSFAATRILTDLHRQIAISAEPALGGTLDVSLWSRPGYASGVQVALPALGPAPIVRAVRLPDLGLIVLDPFTTVNLPWIAVVAAPSTVFVPVPADPALLGAEVVVQALLLDLSPTPAPPHVTGPAFGRILG